MEPEANLRKEEDASVSDDSLEVIVVKKSLEKKCEKVVSGKRSKTPRECTKETRFTKTHKYSSKITSRSGRSKMSDNDEDVTHRVQSSDKQEKSIDDGSMRSNGDMTGCQRDMTDSTSQETVERVVVTAMVHKDQMPDTPKSIFETTKKKNLDDVLKKRMMETDETLGDVGFTCENGVALSRKIDTTSTDKFQQKAQKTQDDKLTVPINMEDTRQKGTNDETPGRKF